MERALYHARGEFCGRGRSGWGLAAFVSLPSGPHFVGMSFVEESSPIGRVLGTRRRRAKPPRGKTRRKIRKRCPSLEPPLHFSRPGYETFDSSSPSRPYSTTKPTRSPDENHGAPFWRGGGNPSSQGCSRLRALAPILLASLEATGSKWLPPNPLFPSLLPTSSLSYRCLVAPRAPNASSPPAASRFVDFLPSPFRNLIPPARRPRTR